jgi:hypothetical protein
MRHGNDTLIVNLDYPVAHANATPFGNATSQ